MSYTLTNEEYGKLRASLKRVIASGDNDKIIDECNRALAIFEAKGYPDTWSNWERAKEDAQWAKRRLLNAENRFFVNG